VTFNLRVTGRLRFHPALAQLEPTEWTSIDRGPLKTRWTRTASFASPAAWSRNPGRYLSPTTQIPTRSHRQQHPADTGGWYR
jgi:hypothetical protein